MDEREELKRWVAFDLQKAGFTRICDRHWETDAANLAAYVELLEASPSEQDLQRFLTEHIRILHPERTSHCRWARAHPKLGKEFEPDFVTARLDSNPGVRWTLVELQRSDADLFTATKERMTDQFDEGIQQIVEWRDWLSENGDYARRPKRDRGLGLNGLTHQADGLILIGRRASISPEHRKRARALTWPHHIEVHTYDWLADEARRTIDFQREYPDTYECDECGSIRHLTHRRQWLAEQRAAAKRAV